MVIHKAYDLQMNVQNTTFLSSQTIINNKDMINDCMYEFF